MNTIAFSTGLSLLSRFVETSGWQTSRSGLMQAVPHLTERVTASDCITALRNLGLDLTFVTGTTCELSNTDLPALRIADEGSVSIILARRDDVVLIEQDPDASAPKWEPISRQKATFVQIGKSSDGASKANIIDFRELLRQFRTTWIALFFASLATNTMALAGPVLIMVIYDRAIPTNATELILALAIAMCIVMLTDFTLRSIRGKAVAYMGASMEGRLSLGLFRKLSALPLNELRKSDVDQQIARLKQFEGMRELFSGPVFSTLLDIPFIFLFLAILFAISPAIGGTMLIACCVFAVAAWATIGPLARRNDAAGKARTAHQKLLFETIQTQRTLQHLGAQELWAARHHRLAKTSAALSGKARRFQLSCQALGQSIMTLSGIAAVFLGTQLAMSNALSFGALVAVMSLVWKCLAPVNALYSNLPQIQGVFKSKRQIDRVFGLTEEFTRGAALSNFKTFRGSISLANVSFRFNGSAEASLQNLGFEIEAGECVVIVGPNGSGKTALLDLLDGLHTQSSGTVKFDGVESRQIAVDDLRHMIGYARQLPEFFHGTVWQNFQLACPDLTRTTLQTTIEQLGLANDIHHFPEGLDTRMTEAFRKTLSGSTLRALSLARCLSRPASIYIFDDPTNGLEPTRVTAFTTTLKELKGQKTLILASAHPEHLAMADRIICLEEGRIVMNDLGDVARRKAAALRNRYKGAK